MQKNKDDLFVGRMVKVCGIPYNFLVGNLVEIQELFLDHSSMLSAISTLECFSMLGSIQKNFGQKIWKWKQKGRTALSQELIRALVMQLLRVLHHGADSCFDFFFLIFSSSLQIDVIIFTAKLSFIEWFELNLIFLCSGATVYIVCRNKERGEAALSKIQAATGNKNVFLEVLRLLLVNLIRMS